LMMMVIQYIQVSMLVYLLALVALLPICRAGYCSDLEAVQDRCLSKALGDTNSWVKCDFCLCQEMGGECRDNGFQEILDCEVRAKTEDSELSCRLVLEEPWLIGFSVIAFVVGSVLSFLIYYYYKTADWSWLWNSSAYKYCKSGECMWDFITCKHFIVFVTCAWCVPIIEYLECDYCNCRDTLLGMLTYTWWQVNCLRPMYGFFCPRWLREICHEQPVFKPSKNQYNPRAQEMGFGNQL
jgi:hypothetical protein